MGSGAGCLLLLALAEQTDAARTLLNAGAAAPYELALLHWGAFVLPVAAFSAVRGFEPRATFGLQACQGRVLAAAAVGGAALYLLLAALFPGVSSEGGEPAARLADGAVLLLAPPEGAAWVGALVGALSPALAQELLFRGYLCTALSARNLWISPLAGGVASGCVSAFFHLAPPLLPPLTLLGAAAGLLRGATGSVYPAMALHCGHSLAALGWRVAVLGGAVAPGPPGLALAGVASGLAAAALAVSLADGAEE